MHTHTLWALVIGFSAVMYTIFDGFDLGVGILLPFIGREDYRDTLVDSISPVWDGNETWIALIGVGMFGGFSEAYSILLPALYIPFILMIIALVLRGVSMEIRFGSEKHKSTWDAVFAGGSLLAAFCQGILLGNLMEGIEVHSGDHFLDTSFRFFNPFTASTGLALVIGYALIGSTWLNFKTTGELQALFKKYAVRLVTGFAAILFLIVSGRFYLKLFSPRFGIFGMDKILSAPSVIWYVFMAVIFFAILKTLKGKSDWLPFALNILLIVTSGVYLVSGFWPYIVPPSLTIYDAGSPLFGSTVLLYAGFAIIPIILGYLLYSYFVFKGKVTGKENYEPRLVLDKSQLQQGKVEEGTKEKDQVIHLHWIWRLLILLAGWFYFFIVLGFWGDEIAVASIIVLIILFLSATFLWKR